MAPSRFHRNPSEHGSYMSKQRPRNCAVISRLLRFAAVVSCALVAAACGCHGDGRTAEPAAAALQHEVQTRIDAFSAVLADSMAKKSPNEVESFLKRVCPASNPEGKLNILFLAVLDTHGVMVATKAEKGLSGAHNLGNYHVVSDAIRKRRPLQSALYLQGDRKVYIVASPLLRKEEVEGVLIIGIDSEELTESGITEKEFMSLVFRTYRSTTP